MSDKKPLDAQTVHDWFKELPYAEMQEVLGALSATLEGHKEQRRKELLEELQALGGVPEPSRRSSAPKVSGDGRGAVKPQYRGPNGELYSGRGRSPKWLQEAEAQGKTREDFRIKE